MFLRKLDTNKRTFERLTVSLPLRFHSPKTNQWSLVRTRDISAQGIGLVSPQDMPVNSPIETWLSVPDSADPLYSTGKIAWSAPVENSQYAVGVFLDKPDLVFRVLQAK